MSDKTSPPSFSEEQQGLTDWDRIDRLTDAEIDAAVQADPDAAPTADREWFRTATLVMPEPKQAISLRIDTDVLRWYRDQGPGYQSRMNAILREYAKAHGAVLADRSARVRRS
ncbi:MAG TPA: BrnA antitoxin family protein [Acetobacteraceae bacterium]|nr:BrnA antitoxin family protein [Acetobacteraceae bacterium]